jgi:hypothetical protein
MHSLDSRPRMSASIGSGKLADAERALAKVSRTWTRPASGGSRAPARSHERLRESEPAQRRAVEPLRSAGSLSS